MNYHDINHEADLAGMQEAEKRHGGAMFPAEIADQYRAGLPRPVPIPKPAPIEVENESADLSPAVKRQIKAVWLILPAVGVGVGAFHVIASGALNGVLGWCIGGGFAVSLLSGLFSGGGRQRSDSGGGYEFHQHHHYYQNNNFGGNAGANQTNR